METGTSMSRNERQVADELLPLLLLLSKTAEDEAVKSGQPRPNVPFWDLLPTSITCEITPGPPCDPPLGGVIRRDFACYLGMKATQKGTSSYGDQSSQITLTRRLGGNQNAIE